MKKSFLIIFLVLFTCIFCFPYSKNNTITVKGYIHSYGNDPFAFPGIETEDGKKYGLSTSSEEEKDLLSNWQGHIVQIKGVLITEEDSEYLTRQLENGVILVDSIKHLCK